jgi:hypothetical protein
MNSAYFLSPPIAPTAVPWACAAQENQGGTSSSIAEGSSLARATTFATLHLLNMTLTD